MGQAGVPLQGIPKLYSIQHFHRAGSSDARCTLSSLGTRLFTDKSQCDGCAAALVGQMQSHGGRHGR